MSESINQETGNQHQNTPSAGDLDAQLAADEASRFQPEVTDSTPPPEPEPKPEPKAADPEPEHVQEPEDDEDDHASRIEKLAFERRDARRRVRELEERLARIEQGSPSEETDDERIERRAAAMTAANQYNERANNIYKAGIKDYPDFEKRMIPLRELGLNPAFVEAADEIGDAHKLLHYLSKNIDEAERIMTLPHHKMGAALGKVAVKVATPPKQQSKAPPPIKPLNGSGRSELSAEDMPIDEYMRKEDERWYNKRR